MEAGLLAVLCACSWALYGCDVVAVRKPPMEVDCIEHNTVVNDKGEVTFVQVIAWDWDHLLNTYVVRQWWKVDESRPNPPRRVGQYYLYSASKHTVRARHYRITRTAFDPEVKNREVLPTQCRSPLWDMLYSY